MSFWKNISRVTPVRKHSTEKSDDKKDRKGKTKSEKIMRAHIIIFNYI